MDYEDFMNVRARITFSSVLTWKHLLPWRSFELAQQNQKFLEVVFPTFAYNPGFTKYFQSFWLTITCKIYTV